MESNNRQLYTEIQLEVLRMVELQFPDWVEFSRDALGEQRWLLYASVGIDLSKTGLVETQSTFTTMRVRSTQKLNKTEEIS